MSEAGPSQYSWHNNTANGNARVHAGHVYGNVTNNFYEDKNSSVDRLLESLSFPEMRRYQLRPLESFSGTYEWIFDDSKIKQHSCEKCASILQRAGWPKCREKLEEEAKFQCAHAIEYSNEVLPSAADKLCSWLRNSQEIFWISGKAGAGKSCFMKFLLESRSAAEMLREWAGHDVTIAGFFFWAAGGELEKSHVGLLRSLLHQILSKEPHLAEILLASGEHTSNSAPSWSISQLNKAFEMVFANNLVSTSFAFFIDGLDEFHGNVPDLLRSLDNLNKSSNVKMCVSSREHNVFRNRYGRRGPRLHTRLHEMTRQDLDAYIQGRLIEYLELQRSADAETGQQLHVLFTAIRDRAEGVFLWVALAVKRLLGSISNDETLFEILRLLEDIPPELGIFIQRSFDSIHAVHRRNAARTFLLMLYVEEEEQNLELLSLALLDSEDRIATADGGQSAEDTVVVRMLDRADQAARRWCKDLVNVHRSNDEERWSEFNYIDFPHRSIRDFIQQKKKDGVLADLAGKDFCPAFTMCSVISQRPYYQRSFEDLQNGLWRNLEIFAETCEYYVDQSKDLLLLDLARSMDAYGHSIRQHEIHWASGNEGFSIAIGLASFDMHLLDDALPGVVFAALLLYLGANRLFWLILDTAPDAAKTQYMQMGLVALLNRTYDRDPQATYQSVSSLLKRGTDPNLMAYCNGPISPWTLFLTGLHNTWAQTGIWTELVSVLDEMLQHGADPDACLEPDSLYMFIKGPARSIERSILLPGSTQRGHGSKVMVPATAAFQIPYSRDSYEPSAKFEVYEKYFPIIKAKLVAASEAKTRQRQIASDGRAAKRKRDNSDQRATRDRI